MRRLNVAFVASFVLCLTALYWLTSWVPHRPMTEARFWDLIASLQVHEWDDSNTDYAPLRDGLKTYPPSEIARFYEILVQKTYALDTRRHYASYSVIPGLSDSFLYSRLAVVARGEAFYDAALKDPTLFPSWSDAAWFEFLMYVPGIVFEEKTGRELDRSSPVSIESFSNVDQWQ